MPAFFRTLEKIKPVYDWAYKIMLFICKLLLIADILITSVTVAGRYFPFFTAPHWGEEMVLTLMVYMAVLSATLAIRKRTHIRMTAFDQYLPKKAIIWLKLPSIKKSMCAPAAHHQMSQPRASSKLSHKDICLTA